MRRGEASLPPVEPRMLVGAPTVLWIEPNVPALVAERMWAGFWKFGWLKRLKNCAPTFNFITSECGIPIVLKTPRFMFVYEGPTKLLRPCWAKLVGVPNELIKLHWLGAVPSGRRACAPPPQWWLKLLLSCCAKRVSVPAEKPLAPVMLLVLWVMEYGRPDWWKKPPLVSKPPVMAFQTPLP